MPDVTKTGHGESGIGNRESGIGNEKYWSAVIRKKLSWSLCQEGVMNLGLGTSAGIGE